MPQKNRKNDALDLIDMQSKFMEELAAPLRPYTQALLNQCSELSKIQEASISQVRA